MEGFYLPMASTSLNQAFGRKVKNRFQENYSQKEAIKGHFFQTSITSMKKIEHCLQLVEDTFKDKTSYEEFSNPWALSPAELEQDQAFIKYLKELDEPISKDELAEWSNDIDLFMEGLTNPDKLETLWEKSKAKKLWDDSQNKSSTQLNRYLYESQPAEDSVSIEDYMSHWCNVIQTPNSPTPQENHRTTQLFSPKERDNLEKCNKFINELSVRIEGGWPPADYIPYDEDLLRHTIGLSPRVKTDKESYPDSDQVPKRNRLAIQSDSDEKIESDKESTSTASKKGELQNSNQREGQQFSEYEELPF
jgi:hypothetical protein